MLRRWQRAFDLANCDEIPWQRLDEKKYLITGSTGLIGSQFVRVLIARSMLSNKEFEIILPVRSPEKAKELFDDLNRSVQMPELYGNEPKCRLTFLKWELGDELPINRACDYVLHAACMTSSSDFKNKPVEVIESIINGTECVLNYGLAHTATRLIFLSTMEVYGDVSVEKSLSEHDLGALDSSATRNSYPIAKLVSEALITGYAQEYSVQALSLRLAQSFGVGVRKDDKRVFAEFGRNVVNGKDIVLFSDGKSKNSYLSTNDAVKAILIAFARGKAGQVYNVANDDTFCSIYEMAELVARQFGGKKSKVCFKEDKTRSATFRKSSCLRLDASKMRNLGWRPQDSLASMYQEMIEDWEK